MGCSLLKHVYNHLIFMKHSIMIRYSITILIECHIDMYRRSLVCACAVYAHARGCVCVCGYVCVYIRTSEFKSSKVCQDIPHEWYI